MSEFAWEILKELKAQSSKCSEELNFNSVAHKAPREAGYVVPPVVSHAREAIAIADEGQEYPADQGRWRGSDAG